METNEYIGIAIFAIVLLAFTAQTAFAFGRQLGQSRERQLADRRINSLLAQENARKPRSQKAKRKPVRRGRLIGTVVANGTSFVV